MTVESRNRTIDHVGTGSETTFSYNFLVYESEHMTVQLDGVTQPSGTYTVNGLGNPGGGTVVFNTAPGNGVRIDLLRIVPLVQLTDYRRYDPFPSETHEKGLDLAIMAAQQIEDTQITALRYRDTDLENIEDANVELPLLTDLHGKFLFWETPSAPYPNGRLVAVDSSPGGGIITTPFTADWLTSGDADVGRAKLGFAPPTGDAFVYLESLDAQALFDFLSRTGTPDERRTRLNQRGSTFAITTQTDAGVNKVDALSINTHGGLSAGAPSGGIPSVRGDLNAEELRVNNWAIRDYSNLVTFPFSGNAIVIDALPNPSDGRTSWYEISVPVLYTDTDGYTIDLQFRAGGTPLTASYVWTSMTSDNSQVRHAGQIDAAFRVAYPGGFRAAVVSSLNIRITSDNNFRRAFWWFNGQNAAGTSQVLQFGGGYLADGTTLDGLQITIAGGNYTAGVGFIRRMWA